MLEVKQISFRYQEQSPIFDALSFSVNTGDIVAVVGPSGCGKTTLLKLIYGLLPLQTGEILWNGKAVANPLETLIPGEKTMKLVEQDFNLMPFAKVYNNVLEHVKRLGEKKRQQEIDHWLGFLNITDLKSRKAADLSGGQMQRVAIAKSMIAKPELLLMDEPFSNLDALTKANLISDLKVHIKQTGTTAILVMHQLEDALDIADKIMVLNNQGILQYDVPATIYEKPISENVAKLFGLYNLLSAADLKAFFKINPNHFHKVGKKYLLRPHQVSIADLRCKHEIVDTSYFGFRTVYRIRINETLIWIQE